MACFDGSVMDALANDEVVACTTYDAVLELASNASTTQFVESTINVVANASAIASGVNHRVPLLQQLRYIFYIIAPSELYFPTLEETPNFIVQVKH